MKVSYSIYELTPLKQANRFSSSDRKKGVLLKAQLGSKTLFADYFPHVPLGDRPCEQFLQEFKFQEDEYDQKVFELLLRDEHFQKFGSKKIQIHQLWTGSEEIVSPVIKYKIKHKDDFSYFAALESGIRVRLDGNALFSRAEYMKYFGEFPTSLFANIEYIEDPLLETDWDGLCLPSARDFIKGTPHQFYIYKPNAEKKQHMDTKIVYSAYLGGNLGTWHAYSELIQDGDLKTIHGIKSEGFYQEEKQFLKGNYHQGFEADIDLVKKIYHDISGREWKQLCSL